MKKIIYILLLLLICCCSGCVDFNGSNIDKPSIETTEAETAINALLSLEKLHVTEVLVVDEKLYFNKNSHYKTIDGFYGYSELKGENGFGNKNIYNSAFEICVLNDSKHFYESYFPSSSLQYLGLEKILKNALNEPLIEGLSCGEVAVLEAFGVVENLRFELGIDSLKDIDKSIKITYEIAIEDGQVYYINLDLTNIFKSFDINVAAASKIYLFSTFDNFLFPEMPEKDVIPSDPATEPTDDVIPDDPVTFPEEDDIQKINELKANGVSYIDGIFQNIKTINDDLNLLSIYPDSGKITYRYAISDESIIDSNGNFTSPDADTEITITISVYYNDECYDTLSYNFICLGKPVVSGVYGSITNPLYQGIKPATTLDVYFIEMVQQYGDSVYIKAGDFDMLIDAGQSQDGSNIKNFLKQYITDQTLECVIATHAHSDHIGGMMTAFQAVSNIGYVVDYGYARSSYNTASKYSSYIKANVDHYYAVYDAVRNQNGALKTVYITEEIYIDFLDTNQYLKPGVDIGGSDNNKASVTFMFHYYGKQFYFSGDLDAGGETHLVNTKQVGDIDVMKATHHASSSGNSKTILNVMKPEYVIVSAALVDPGSKTTNAQNQSHPNAKALSNFYSVNAKVYCNFTNGTIKVSVKDGEISVTGLGSRNGYYMDSKLIKNENNFEFKDTAWAKKYR